MLDAGAVDSFNTALRCGNQSRTSYTYDVLDEQTSVTGINWATTTTTIDGRQRKITNGNGHMTTYTYDDLGRLVQVVEPAGGMTMTYTYTPVSYTHLRAHETVLDLVCRLLLEKKKR